MMHTSTATPQRRTSSMRAHARHRIVSDRRARRSLRARVAEAFRRMAHGARDKAAYAATVQFYRSGGQDWTRQLG